MNPAGLILALGLLIGQQYGDGVVVERNPGAAQVENGTRPEPPAQPAETAPPQPAPMSAAPEAKQEPAVQIRPGQRVAPFWTLLPEK